MTKFIYNNTKNTNIKHISLKLNYGYYLYILFKKNTNYYSKSKLIEKIPQQDEKSNDYLLQKLLLYLKVLEAG